MRFIITVFWSIGVSFLLGYILPSMGGYEFELMPVLFMAGIFSLIAFFVGEGYIRESK
ncbi:YjzD family protein [Amphibacillus sp. MSJ-3]|uniref:DUF2929 family protein n=1 Tax=Amphibacillus sp. MSJ-3 TaxID=2841505 RepID=UPI001C0EB536|nr:DUF2929 family protein [Amphibacillus sp. MSJ-3]MBU5595221.1 YjzD family protein [Amphibacillus sp. MSJ-3]